MAGLQSGEGRMVMDSVVWALYINVTDTQTATSLPRSKASLKKRFRLLAVGD